MSWKVAQREVVDKKDVLLWDLWFVVMHTVVHSSVVVLGIIVLCIGAAYCDSLILSCYKSDYLDKVPHLLHVLSTVSNPFSQAVAVVVSGQFALNFGAAGNNCIVASICDI